MKNQKLCLEYRNRVFSVALGVAPFDFHSGLSPFFRRSTGAISLSLNADENRGIKGRLTLIDPKSSLAYPCRMKLGEKEGQVLACMRLYADAPIPTVARTLGAKESSVRLISKRLLDNKIIAPLKLINVSKLGYTEYDITCGLALRGAGERKKFFDYLSRSNQVSQVVEAGGAYHCTFTVCARTPAEVDSFLTTTGEKFGPIFINECIGVCLRYSIFPPKYLSGKKFLKDIVVVSTETADPSIDSVDRRMLAALSRHPEFSDRELARSLGMPISTVNYRLKALVQKGTIVGTIHMIQPHLFEHQMFRVYLSVRSLNADIKRKIALFAKENPHVTYLVEWLGDWQFGLGVMVAHSAQASELVNQLYDLIGDSLNELTLFPIGKDLKMEFFPFD